MSAASADAALARVAWGDDGLVPVVTQDLTSGDVLMLAYADREALARTLELGEAHYHSRSRGVTWHKGATSGNLQEVVEVRYDCDADALLYRVRPAGPACHTGERSCFFRVVSDAAEGGGPGGGPPPRPFTDPDGPVGIGAAMGLLQRVVDERLRTLPEGSYVRTLHDRGVGYVAQKVVEEAGETVVAALEGASADGRAAAGDGPASALLEESADLLFHLTVLLALRGVGLDDVARVLTARHRDRGGRGTMEGP